MAKAVVAFTQQRTWKQADLARHLELESRQVRKLLRELAAAGVPLERQEEHPHVYWSVPKGWLPGAASLSREQVASLLGLLIRLPQSPARDASLQALSPLAPGTPVASEVAHHDGSGMAADSVWECVHLALQRKSALRFRYHAASRGTRSRVVSPQRIDDGKAVHLIALCHESGELRRFHFARIEHIKLDPLDDYRPVDKAEVDRFMRESVDGYNDPAGAIELCFYVDAGAAPWVAGDLPAGLTPEPLDDGRLRVCAYVAGLSQVARYVVGLGAAAQIETPALRDAVAKLAGGALGLEEKPEGRSLDLCSVSAKRSTE